jgi:hypothetical protein
MSRIWECNDGTTDITGRGTPGKIPCENNDGVWNGDTSSQYDMIRGCMDPDAENFLPNANSDDGSCITTIPDDITIITDSTPTTAGFGDNKMLIYLVAAGALLWYLNKEGYLNKILK